LARVYEALARRDSAKANALAREGIEEFPKELGREEFYLLMCWGKGWEEQVTSLSRAIEIRPQYAWAFSMLGYARGCMRDSKGAIRAYSQAIDINPRFGLAYGNRGGMKAEMGDVEGAIADWSGGYAHYRKGDVAAAIADGTKALELAQAGWPDRTEAQRLLDELQSRK